MFLKTAAKNLRLLKKSNMTSLTTVRNFAIEMSMGQERKYSFKSNSDI